MKGGFRERVKLGGPELEGAELRVLVITLSEPSRRLKGMSAILRGSKSCNNSVFW